MELMRKCVAVSAVALATCAVAATAGPVAPARADTVVEFPCTSGLTGFDYCRTLGFEIYRCRGIGVRLLFNDDGSWSQVEVRRGRSDDKRWRSAHLKPNQYDNGWVAGTDRMYPGIYVDSDGFDHEYMLWRLRFRCP